MNRPLTEEDQLPDLGWIDRLGSKVRSWFSESPCFEMRSFPGGRTVITIPLPAGYEDSLRQLVEGRATLKIDRGTVRHVAVISGNSAAMDSLLPSLREWEDAWLSDDAW